jgi:hypothetical protein
MAELTQVLAMTTAFTRSLQLDYTLFRGGDGDPLETPAPFSVGRLGAKYTMTHGYTRVSTDGWSVNAQVTSLRRHGAGKVFREVASGAKTERAQLRHILEQLEPATCCL